MNKGKKIVSIFFLIGIISITIYVFIVIASTEIPYFTSPDGKTTIHIPLDMWGGERFTVTPDIEIHVILQYDKILVAGKKVFINATGVIHNSSLMDITKIDVGFKLSLAYPPENDEFGMPKHSFMWVYNKDGNLSGNGTYLYWSTPGDFVPTAVIYRGNMAYPNEFPISNVHVEPRYVLQTEEYNRINLGLSYAFFYFGLIGAIYIFYELWKNNS